MIYKFYM